MELEEVFKIIEKFDASESSYLEIQIKDDYIKLKKQSNIATDVANAVIPVIPGRVPVAETNNESQVEAKDYVRAPLVGVFYEAASPDQEPYVKVGSHVSKGDTLCLIEAMKMMNEVTAPKNGVIKEILVSNTDMVEYDTPLFVIEE